jgi:hypothetical protein
VKEEVDGILIRQTFIDISVAAVLIPLYFQTAMFMFPPTLKCVHGTHSCSDGKHLHQVNQAFKTGNGNAHGGSQREETATGNQGSAMQVYDILHLHIRLIATI